MNIDKPDWMEAGACTNTDDDFFPTDRRGRQGHPSPLELNALAICARCPVRLHCRDYAIEERIAHGIWGGTTELDRRRIFKRLALQEKAA